MGHAPVSYPSPTASAVRDQSNADLTPSTVFPGPPPNNNASTPGSSSDQTSDTLPGALSSHQQTFSHLDLELIHYYSTQTYMTLTSKLEAHFVWRDIVFHQGLKHKFLLHALMATAALHKATNHAEDTDTHAAYIKVAFQYQNLALAGYIPELSRPNEENAIALFILSALLTIWLFGSKKLPEALNGVNLTASPNFLPRVMRTGHEEEKTPDFLEILTLVQGINAVIKQTRQWLRGGEIEPLLKPPRDSDLPPNPPDIQTSFQKLRYRIEHPNARDQSASEQDLKERKDIYMERLESLMYVSRSRTVLEYDQQIFAWPVTSETPYIDLIRCLDPTAIALFIHWAACFRCLEHLWWAKGWSYRLIEDAMSLLDRSWDDILAWPKKEVGLE
ncbi:hypothetical protein LTR05_004359 [Lithohypha guttulata]|uniref:Uncharacterized protein n=1 Tax=Lithohypha guttulata TaxID=1690604 RepID=A0AAN7T3D4_9EURO|nr:hypothetical protein LTR05_004359 [Lithohypha guttulata]